VQTANVEFMFEFGVELNTL